MLTVLSSARPWPVFASQSSFRVASSTNPCVLSTPA